MFYNNTKVYLIKKYGKNLNGGFQKVEEIIKKNLSTNCKTQIKIVVDSIEEALDALKRIENFDIEIEQIKLPLKFRCGVCEWEGNELSGEVKKCLRLYPQDNDTDGFFVAKIIKKSDKGCEE